VNQARKTVCQKRQKCSKNVNSYAFRGTLAHHVGLRSCMNRLTLNDCAIPDDGATETLNMQELTRYDSTVLLKNSVSFVGLNFFTINLPIVWLHTACGINGTTIK
jgi:hypothetical protein